MTQRSRDILKTYYETGDYPTELQFADFIDSTPNLTDESDVFDANGFTPDQRVNSSIDFSDLTRAFTISPNGSEFYYFQTGIKYEKTTAENVIITDIEGLHAIYYDGDILSSLANPNNGEIDNIIRNKTLVAYVYWNAESSESIFLADERHGISMSPATHSYLHFTRGAQYLEGLVLDNIISTGDGDENIHAQFGVESGIITDEDLLTIIPQVLSTIGCPVYYLEGANGSLRRAFNPGFSILNTGSGRMAYNEWTGLTWQLTEVTNNDFALCHIFATNDVNNPVIAIMGQDTYINTSQARTGANNEISNLIIRLNIQESIPVATVIFQTSTSYTNNVHSRIITTDSGDDYISWLSTELAQGASPTDHQNLANLFKAGIGVPFGHIDDQAQTIVGEKTFTGNLKANGQAHGGDHIKAFSAAATFDADDGNNQYMEVTASTTLEIENELPGTFIIDLEVNTLTPPTITIGTSFGLTYDDSHNLINANGDINTITIYVNPNGTKKYTINTLTA